MNVKPFSCSICIAFIAQVLLVGDVTSIDTVSAMIQAEGYTVEMHTTCTDDQYLVAAHRIRARSKPDANGPAPVVFLMHGLFNSAADWLLFGRRYSAGYLFADAGYDVWLGNARGTRVSRGHRTLDADRSERYWAFSFHEIGRHDVPALVEMALRVTNTTALHYVGHSQGCTTFFIALAERPEFGARIRSMHALAPAVLLHRSEATPELVLGNIEALQQMMHRLHVAEFSTRKPMYRQLVGPLLAPLCAEGTVLQMWCVGGLFRAIDTESPPLSPRYAANLMHNTPDSVSIGQLVHFGQLIRSGRFQRYDWGVEGNRRRYGDAGVEQPPEYELGNLTMPVFAMFGDEDFITPAPGVRDLCRRLGEQTVRRAVEVGGFNHFDFVYSRLARGRVYRKIVANWRAVENGTV